jgi:hypothetical protein
MMRDGEGFYLGLLLLVNGCVSCFSTVVGNAITFILNFQVCFGGLYNRPSALSQTHFLDFANFGSSHKNLGVTGL